MSTRVALPIGVDVLGVERDAGLLQFGRDARMHRLQAADRGEQAERRRRRRRGTARDRRRRAAAMSPRSTSVTMKARVWAA